MSEVISFRLNKDNLREAKALLILQEWGQKGYSIRQTITEALLKLDQNAIETEPTTFDELNETLSQVLYSLKQIESDNSPPSVTHPDNAIKSGLYANFVTAVKESAKPGLQIAS